VSEVETEVPETDVPDAMCGGRHRDSVLTPFARRQLVDGPFVSIPEATAPIQGAHYVVTPADGPDVTTDALLFVDWLRERGNGGPTLR
jgi:hypothetical protein